MMTVTPYPAGLSTDSLDLDPATAGSPPGTLDEQWSDAHETFDTDTERDAIEEVEENTEDLTVVQAPKLSADSDKTHTHEIQTPSPTNIETTNAQERASDVDATSVHSMPIVQVTEPTSPTLPATPRSVRSHRSSATAVSNTSLAPPAHSANVSRERPRRNRATLDTRASNRFSGFLSNLIHRRDHPPNPPPEQPLPPTLSAKDSSRASSPAPPRPTTPPPQLPPPSLDDLGLSLSSLTAHISPAHLSNPPISGAFLAPHYLLLCHSQGLDVLPLVSPPAPQPYALVRRAAFKSVVVMEHRGVLVAIAGRRDGVRVYALEEIRRMVDWRMEVEVRREREKARREETKRPMTTIALVHSEESEKRDSTEKQPAIVHAVGGDKMSMQLGRRSSLAVPPGQPRPPVIRTPKPKTPVVQSAPPEPSGPPPAYSSSPPLSGDREPEQSTPPTQPAPASITTTPRARSRATSVSEVLAGTMSRRHTLASVQGETEHQDDTKGDWASSDDEAINVMAAPSGSQLLDERTSAMASATASPTGAGGRVDMPRSQTAPSLSARANRRSRPANLDLSLSRSNTNIVPVPPPSPTPTLLTLRQALSLGATPRDEDGALTPDPDGDADAEEEEDAELNRSSPPTPTRERITLAEALFESRLPDIPPAGSRREQEPIIINTQGSAEGDVPASPRTSESHSTFTRQSTSGHSNRRRRRWSVLGGVFSNPSGQSQSSIPSLSELGHASPPQEPVAPEMRERRPAVIHRSHSGRVTQSVSNPAMTPVRPPRRPSTSPGPSNNGGVTQSSMDLPPPLPQAPASHSRFLPRILTNALGRRSDDVVQLPRAAGAGSDRPSNLPPPPHAPAPKLEYVKLPGTKGAVAVKAVETAKKSFLAILCGDNGEKVELFAGTYRTALGLSRTFILPDSPRSLELQLQGDDLVEVFLVFSQNVFGLEPATVRVREVRIGRAERRAARRRARENQAGTSPGDADTDGAANGEEDASVSVTIGIAPTPPAGDDPLQAATSGNASPPVASTPQLQIDGTNGNTNSTDELVTLAAAQMSPYTTFQQLSFAPNFPLATIADEYIIPPTYREFIEYRNQYEPEVDGTTNVDLSQVQFSPPGLPVPTPAPPSKWFYRDPKGVIHGPWKASLMQAWYRDGLLPPDLPVRREEDTEYVLLRELRLQCVDPASPFRSSPPAPSPAPAPVPMPITDASKPLLPPQSLLSQPKHFGPPALFYSSRGGHSTTIVDSRGRSVLKGRFMWSIDEESQVSGRLGDVKRLEAFDVKDRAVLVAMRQGGLEAVDFGDALLKPGDHSRTILPHFHPPLSSTNRRGPCVWKIGTPLDSSNPQPEHIALPVMTRTGMGPRKKQSTGPSKSPGRSDFIISGDGDDAADEVIFLGRKGDEMYLCEKSSTSFRVLKLSPSLSAS
ncbi:hypothetical protein BD310DRAFT_838557 [Dichomitus squalens]|uniref:GYF domain-containing protein n=1 Tax=Dichomitus squalens TaxID=114155 RepID=A0A4Q9QBB9_9APHY|nr:hypothetical protein BD310DRAFT_838557 [Dichomitus squalens]